MWPETVISRQSRILCMTCAFPRKDTASFLHVNILLYPDMAAMELAAAMTNDIPAHAPETGAPDQNGVTVVQVAGAVTTQPKGQPMSPRHGAMGDPVTAMEARMAHVARLVTKVGDSWAPWKAEKNKTRASQAVADLASLRTSVLHQLDTITRLEREKAAHEELRHKSVGQAEAIAKLRAQLAEMSDAKAEKAVAVTTMLTKVEGVSPGPKRYLKLDEKKEAELLHAKVDQLVREHEKLKGENDKLAHSKLDLAKRIKEVTDKARDDAEVRDREMRKLQTEIKRVNDSKEADIKLAKAEAAEQLAVRARELKAVQKRMEAMKVELDSLKGREQSVKKETDQATIAANKSHQEKALATKKASEARTERDEMAQQLALMRDDMAVVTAQYAEVTKAHAALCKEAGKPLPTYSFKDSGATFPRQAFTDAGSPILHNCSCGKVCAKLEAREYSSAKELEAWIAEGQVILCGTCKASGF